MVTTPAGVIFRMVSLLMSATKTLPLSSAATPQGLRNRALVPMPSLLPGWPASPAKVLTTPFGCDLPNGIVGRIRHINIAGTIHRNAKGSPEARIAADAVGAAVTSSHPRQGAYDSVRRNFPDRVVGSVRHINIAGTVHRNAVGQPKSSLVSGTISVAADANLSGQCGYVRVPTGWEREEVEWVAE